MMDLDEELRRADEIAASIGEEYYGHEKTSIVLLAALRVAAAACAVGGAEPERALRLLLGGSPPWTDTRDRPPSGSDEPRMKKADRQEVSRET